MFRLLKMPVKAVTNTRSPKVGPGLNIKAPPATGFAGMPQPSFLESYWPVNYGPDGLPRGWTFGPVNTGAEDHRIDNSGMKG